MKSFAAILALLLASCVDTAHADRPNIVLILADDVGYGDLSCYGAKQIKTPNLDRLAAGGLRFTDGHAPSATCTPTRYALLTGEYAWRKKGTGVLPGDANLIIEPGRFTLPDMLKRAGYATGVVGKWHLGLGRGKIDWNGEITPGPREIGFDESFIIAGTGDRVPCVYVENQRVAGLDPQDPIEVNYQHKVGDEPTGRENPELLKMPLSHGHDFTIVNGISRIGWMKGGKAARWVDEDMADTLVSKATQFIEDHQQEPFFLYFPTHDAHVPRVPHARFRGTSGCGVRGDVIQELDWCVGQVMETLDRLGLSDNALVIFTSDNGPVLDDGYADGAVADANGHVPAGPWRGGKYSTYEGGTRVPFLVRWPGRIKPGKSDALVCQIDLLASLAALAGQAVPRGAAPDSENVLAALLGESPKGREILVEHAAGLALRKGQWKYVAPRPPRGAVAKGQAAGQPTPGELYDLAVDPGETKNLASDRPELARELDTALNQIRSAH
jgi:arylsulfatase A-like enzyme